MQKAHGHLRDYNMLKAMCKISIIIPAYNAEKTIQNAIKSVLKQVYRNFEIVVVDGDSKDGTLKAVGLYSDPRIRVFSGPDRGAYDAMNKGIDIARGDWLYFLGSDDQLRDDAVLSSIAPLLDDGRYDLVYGNAFFLKKQCVYDGVFTRQKLIRQGNICHQAVFYHKALFERLGKYNLKFKIWADWDFNIRCFSYPAIRHHYVDLIIADYNDIDGISNQVSYDPDFLPLLAVNTGTNDIENFKKTSKEYKLGKLLLKPKQLIEKFVKKIEDQNSMHI